jgi:glutamate-1-semialdehyde aminotransferase
VTGFQAIVQGISACGCQLYMTPLKKIREYRDFQSCDSNKYMHFHKLLMKNGVFTHPAQMEHMLVSTADTEQDIEKALESQQHRLLRS